MSQFHNCRDNETPACESISRIPGPLHMTALSLTQPWATLVVIGAKKIETRSWSTRHRGPVLIHASKGFPAWAKDLCNTPLFARALSDAGIESWHDLPLGAVVGGATIADCVSTNLNRVMGGMSEKERVIETAFGDYNEDRYGWHLSDAWRLPEPVPCRGSLSLWAVPDEVAEIVAKLREGGQPQGGAL